MALPKGYYKASPIDAAGIEIVVYSDGKNYFSYENSDPTKPLDDSELAELVIETEPLFLCEQG